MSGQNPYPFLSAAAPKPRRDDRITVWVGRYKVGDWIGGKVITRLGRPWDVRGEAGPWHFATPVMVNCRCGNWPIYAPAGMCRTCINKTYGKVVGQMQYAYIRKPQPQRRYY